MEDIYATSKVVRTLQSSIQYKTMKHYHSFMTKFCSQAKSVWLQQTSGFSTDFSPLLLPSVHLGIAVVPGKSTSPLC